MLPGALALLISAAVAGEEADGAVLVEDAAARSAEYHRLAEEIQKLAARNAWSGVERFYTQLVATGVPMQFDELVAGAHSARAVGDVKAVRDRLEAASKLQEQRDVLEWMWEIDTNYGAVWVACDDAKKKRPELTSEAVPFDPNQQRAVEFAKGQVAETCLFDGMLPGGKYALGHITFEVAPRLESVRIDARNVDFRKQGSAPAKDDKTASQP